VIQVNLLPKEERVSEPRISWQMPRARIWLPALIFIAVLLPVGGMYLMQRARILSLREDFSQTEFELRNLKPQLEKIDQLMAAREQLNLRLAIIQGLCRERYTAVETLDHLADTVPDYLWLTRTAQTGPNQITVEGMAFSNLMVAELMSRMEQSDIFEGVALTVAEKAKVDRGNNPPVLSFALTARVKP
jgi:Tfp pilus assembly protein PilN